MLILSVDIEADGPIPGPFSMLSMGAVAFQDGKELGEFSCNFELLDGAVQDPDTMSFWAKFPDAYAQTRTNLVTPLSGMQSFRDWLKDFKHPTLIGYPVTFDFMWVYWYYWNFLGEMPSFGFSGMDIKTLMALKLNIPYRKVAKRIMPKHWRGTKYTHTLQQTMPESRASCFITSSEIKMSRLQKFKNFLLEVLDSFGRYSDMPRFGYMDRVKLGEEGFREDVRNIRGDMVFIEKCPYCVENKDQSCDICGGEGVVPQSCLLCGGSGYDVENGGDCSGCAGNGYRNY